MKQIFASLVLALSPILAFAGIIIGNGKIASETRELPAFSSISVSGSGTLRVHRGPQKVVVACDSNILPYISTTVVNGELVIGIKPLAGIINATKYEYDVTLPELRGLRQSGSGESYVDKFSGDGFSGSISGSGGIKAELDYSKVELKVSGSAGFDATVVARDFSLRGSGSGYSTIKGRAISADLSLSGSGGFGGKDFSVDEARIGISGSGRVDIRANKRIDATMSGSGSLRYWGNPAVSQRTSGSGRLAKAGD